MSKTMSDSVAEARQRFTQEQRERDADREKARVRRAQDVLARMEEAKAALALETVQVWPISRWQIDDDGDVRFLFDYDGRAFDVAFVPKSRYADGYWRVWCDGKPLGNADAGHLAEWCAEWYVRARAVQAERQAEVARELATKEAVDLAQAEYDILVQSRDAGLNAATLTWLAERGIEFPLRYRVVHAYFGLDDWFTYYGDPEEACDSFEMQTGPDEGVYFGNAVLVEYGTGTAEVLGDLPDALVSRRDIEVAGYTCRTVPDPLDPQETITIVEPAEGETARINVVLPTGCWWLHI